MENKVVKLKCPTCGRQLKLGKNSLAKKIVCPNCNARFRVEQNISTIIAEERELFGPPINDSFADIDAIIDDQDNANRQGRSKRTQKPLSAANQTSAVNEQWQQQKKVTTKLDESLHRNGVGLLVLSAGLSAIPVFASNVEGLEAIALYLPIAAVCLAFIATFMLAYSHRRGSVASIVLCMFPFILISVTSLISYLFFVQPMPKAPRQTVAQTDRSKDDDDLDSPEIDDELLDKAPVQNSPTESFAPPRLKQPESNLRPVAPRTENDFIVQENVVKDSQLRPSQTVQSATTNDDAIDNELRTELARAKQISEDNDKTVVLKKRIKEQLQRVLISKGNTVGLETGLSISESVGRETVYGSAIYSLFPIQGFDVGRRKQSDSYNIDIVPIVNGVEFEDSFVVPEGNVLLGVHFNFVNGQIAGVQPVFGNDRDRSKNGKWMGISGSSNRKNLASILSDRQIHGFVIYRDQLRAVGAALVIGEKRAIPLN